jgi:hypothetical protein
MAPGMVCSGAAVMYSSPLKPVKHSPQGPVQGRTAPRRAPPSNSANARTLAVNRAYALSDGTA